jgi:hypothetical protein
VIPLSPALLIACAAGRMSGRTAFSCRLNRDHRYGSLRYPARDDEAASIHFVNGVGFWAHFDYDVGESSWPIPHLERVAQLARYGLQRRVLHHSPELGDLVVKWNTIQNRYTRVSIVVSIIGVSGKEGKEVVKCRTLTAHRRGAFARPERFVPFRGDRFLRWADLDERSLFGVAVTRAA